MIIKGGTRSGARLLAEHLQKTDSNEVVQILDVRGTAATDLEGAFREMTAVASGTRCKYPLYHASINTAAHERLTPEQWRRSVDVLSERLGFADQPRAVVRHIKQGREHVHIVWSRIDAEKMQAISDSHNYRAHEEAARQLEQEFGLARVEGVHTGDRDQARPVAEINQAEQQQAERTGLTVAEAKAAIQGAWQRSDDGAGFARELDMAGYVLARGDRRELVIIDREGGLHSPRRRLGLKAAEIKTRCADLDPASLPDVEEAREMQEQRALEPQQQTEAPAKDTPTTPATPTRDEMPPAVQPSTAQADSDRADQMQKGVEAGMGFFERLFTKAAEMFDAVREKLFGAVFGPMGDREETSVPPPPAPMLKDTPALVPVEVEKTVEPEKPKDKAQARPYEPRRVSPPSRDPARDRDHEGRERIREIELQPPPDEEPDGGET